MMQSAPLGSRSCAMKARTSSFIEMLATKAAWLAAAGGGWYSARSHQTFSSHGWLTTTAVVDFISGDISATTSAERWSLSFCRELWKKERRAILRSCGSPRSRMYRLSWSMIMWNSTVPGSICAAIPQAWPIT